MMFLRLLPQPERQPLPLFSSMPAIYTSPVTLSPVIWTSRMNVAPLLTWIGLLQVAPLSVERTTKMSALAKLKSFQEIYMFPKKGELGLLSAQPDSRSAEPSLKTQKWVQLAGEGSDGVAD